MTKILLTFTGFHDPYFSGSVDGIEQLGPIMSLLAARSFDKAYLFSTPRTSDITTATKRAIGDKHARILVEILDMALDDPTDHIAILKNVRKHLKIIQKHERDADFSIAVASGTPAMHACLLLLAASGEIPARILQTRPPQFVTKERPPVSELNLSARDFPTVRKQVAASVGVAADEPDLRAAAVHVGIIGEDDSITKAMEMAAALAPSAAPVLILGETGTGKELFARLIHRLSGRPLETYSAVNCAAIPADLVESTLFGHKRGAFTGAVADQTGKFTLANGGTLFLDEIGDLPLSMQAKLLRVLQDGIINPLGDRKQHRVDVRIIGATNHNLRKMVKQGKFREDLYYRLNVGEIQLPPLRDRRSDIPILGQHILDRVNASLRRPKRLTTAALKRLQIHSWPGNVRDLENVIERSARLCSGDILDAGDLMIAEPVATDDPLDLLPVPEDGFSMEEFLTSARKQLILRALDTSDGNQSEAARLLGITPQAVHKFLNQKRISFNRS